MSELTQPDTGFVFAMPMEAAGVLDRLDNRRTTKGGGIVYHTGIFAKRPVVLTVSGIGLELARGAAERLVQIFHPKKLVSAGYAGGLSVRMKKMTLCVPQQVVCLSDGKILKLTEPIPQTVSSTEADKLTLLTADRPINTPQEKKNLGELYGAELVDMETFGVADVCRKHQISFLSVRSILDSLDEAVPEEAVKLQTSANSGTVALAGTLAGILWRNPKSLLKLLPLRMDAIKATEKLAKQIAFELRCG